MTKSKRIAIAWLSLVTLLMFASCSVALPRPSFMRGRHGLRRISPASTTSSYQSKQLQIFYYPQTLDHFNYKPESYTKFKQRYLINFKYWGGAETNAPIFVYFGGEDPLDKQVDYIGFLPDNAAQFKAILVYIKALADFAEIILHVKKKLHAQYSPVIVAGASYGGMLAAWLRLKYPHVALGAFASSAPILYFDHIVPQDAFYEIVTKDFKEASETCFQSIRDSWAEIDKVASQPNGLQILSKKFRTCKISVYEHDAQYNDPPRYPASLDCKAIDETPGDLLDKIFAAVVASRGNRSCYVNSAPIIAPGDDDILGWFWQECTEIISDIGIVKNSMFPPDPFNLTRFIQYCNDTFGVVPRPHWVTDYYGGHDIKLILKRFASNIIFSNGLKDPCSGGGVLQNISDTIVAINTVNGSHCLDFKPSRADDPKWLILQREEEVKIVRKWITRYYADLNAYKH